MNRFEDLLEALKRKPGSGRVFDYLKDLDDLPTDKVSGGKHTLRMPYSSEPTPLDPAWD